MVRHVTSLLRRVLARHSMIAAYLALLLASSTAAYAAATIGSPEVINNSLQSVDLKDGAAVGSVDVINDTLNGVDINEATLNGVGRKLLYSTAATEAAPRTTIATVSGYSIKGRCYGGSAETYVGLWVNGPAGDFQGSMWWWSNDNDQVANAQPDAGGGFITAATDTFMTDRYIQTGGYVRGAGTWWIHSGTTLLEVSIHAFADRRTSPGNCFIYGTVTKAV